MTHYLTAYGFSILCLVSSAPGQDRQDSGRISKQLLFPQDSPDPDQTSEASKRECREIFDSIRRGIAEGNMGVFSRYFGSQVLVNIRGGESGYYSPGQSYYVLENHFKTRKVLLFDFSTVGGLYANPYATGSAWFNVKGSRESAQVYVSLTHMGGRWVIAQINIY